nr:hypothetical protein [Stenotrophomonas pavanii]
MKRERSTGNKINAQLARLEAVRDADPPLAKVEGIGLVAMGVAERC